MVDLSLVEVFGGARVIIDDPHVGAASGIAERARVVSIVHPDDLANLAHDARSSRRYRSPSEREEKRLRPIRANVGIEAAYRARLETLIEEMAASIEHWLPAAYRGNPPEIGQDELPATTLRKAIEAMKTRWFKRFDEAAPKLAKYFATKVSNRSDAVLKKILKDGGFAIEFRMTQAQRDVVNATVQANVSLIKSIPQQYLTQVEGIVMRGVQTGRDVGYIAKALRARVGVEKRRAALIARDQSNKATACLTRARQLEVGIDEAEWVHSGGGRHPRPSHVKAGRDRVRFNLKKGWFDPDEQKWILPGELINCRCSARPIIKGLR